jgi:hypothetical protein
MQQIVANFNNSLQPGSSTVGPAHFIADIECLTLAHGELPNRQNKGIRNFPDAKSS